MPEIVLPTTRKRLLASSPSTPTASTEHLLDPFANRRVLALLDAYPTLSLPIASAMVERAAQEPTGLVLNQLEHALDQFDTLPDASQLSGSQMRVLDVALRQIAAKVANLQAKLQSAWEDPA